MAIRYGVIRACEVSASFQCFPMMYQWSLGFRIPTASIHWQEREVRNDRIQASLREFRTPRLEHSPLMIESLKLVYRADEL